MAGDTPPLTSPILSTPLCLTLRCPCLDLHIANTNADPELYHNTITNPLLYHTHKTQTIILRLFWILSRTTWVSRCQKGKTNLDLLQQEIVSGGSGISWATIKSAPWPRQPCQHPHYSINFFTGWMPFLPPKKQHQSTLTLTRTLMCRCRLAPVQIIDDIECITAATQQPQ